MFSSSEKHTAQPARGLNMNMYRGFQAQPTGEQPKGLDWTKKKLTQLAGGTFHRSEEYKNLVTALDNYKDLDRPGTHWMPGKQEELLFELQGYAITWLEKHQDDTDPKVNSRRAVIEQFAYVDIIHEITRVKGQFTEGKVIGTVGSGQISEVKDVDYQDESGFVEKRLFKPAETTFSPDVESAVNSGIPLQQALLVNRAVASYVLDQLLGFNVTVKTDYALEPDKPVNQKRLGIAMAMAEGVSPQMEGKKDEFGEAQHFYRKIPLTPGLSAQLSTLQMLDAITGQVDRHPGNYFISSTGKVTGIDNDFSFGKNRQDVKTPTSQADKYRSFPLYVDKAMAVKIQKVSAGEVRKALRPHLPPQEIEATILRLIEAKFQLAKMEKDGNLMDANQWNQIQTAESKNPDSYVGSLEDAKERADQKGKAIPFDPNLPAQQQRHAEKDYLVVFDSVQNVLGASLTDLKAKNDIPKGFTSKDLPSFKLELLHFYEMLMEKYPNLSENFALQAKIDQIMKA